MLYYKYTKKGGDHMAYNVSGKSIRDLMKYRYTDLEKMSQSDVRAITQRLASAANKRVKRMFEKGVETRATVKLEESGGKISTKGKNKDELILEFLRAKEFLMDPHSNLRTHRKIIKRTQKKMKKMFGEEFDEWITEQTAAIVDELTEIYPELQKKEERYAAIKTGYKLMKDMGYTPEEVYGMLKRTLDDAYERQQTLREQFEEDASAYFRW